MICRQCGNEMRDDAKFCPHCGALNTPAGSGLPEGGAAYSAPAYTGPEAPVPGGGTKKGLIIGGIAALAAVAVVIVVMANGLFSSSKDQVEKAAANSIAAYAQIQEALNWPDLTQLSLEQSISQRLSFKWEGLNTDMFGYDLSPLEGLGLRFGSDLSGKDRKLGLELAAFWDEEDIISVQVAADDNELYFSSPELTDGEFYGVNTETLGDDLAVYGVEDVENISFNLFDVVDIVTSSVEQQEQAKESLKDANKALAKAVAVKKQGAETLNINGTMEKTISYRVTIPQKALEDYTDALVEILDSVDYVQLYEEIFRAIGMPEEELEYFLYTLERADPYGELADSVKDLLAELGDVELDVCLYDGYVASVHWSGTIYRSDIELTLTLGGGEEYVDDLGLEMTVSGVKMTISSTGDHAARSGAFTDQTTIRAGTTRVTSNLRYVPNGSGNNFSWEVGVPASVSVAAEGSLTTTENSVALHLENLAFKFLSTELVRMSADYYAGPYDGQSVTVSSPKLITEMDGLALMALGVKLQTNAQSWLAQTEDLFFARLPADLLQMMM